MTRSKSFDLTGQFPPLTSNTAYKPLSSVSDFPDVGNLPPTQHFNRYSWISKQNPYVISGLLTREITLLPANYIGYQIINQKATLQIRTCQY